MSSIFGESYAYEHNGDLALLQELGISTGPFGREWTDLGTVTVQEAETTNEYHCRTGPRPAAVVKVEVVAYPAQFWRFTVTRPRDETENDPEAPNGFRSVYEPVEVFEITTGSGGFSDYWPIAKAVAQNMVNVKVAERV